MTRRRSRVAWLSSGVVMALSVAAYVASPWKPSSPRLSEQPPSVALRLAPTARQSSPPNSRGPVSPDAAVPMVPAYTSLQAASDLRLELKPRGTCWVSASADGAEVLSRLMNVGERASVTAVKEIVLRVGDPANCAFDINGAGTRQLGAAGTPMTLHLTPDNVGAYVQPGRSR